MPRSVASLQALDSSGALVERQDLDLHEYWDQSHPLIDSDEYRSGRAISVVVGDLFDESGQLIQHFVNRYSPSGHYLGGRAEHADGTVNED